MIVLMPNVSGNLAAYAVRRFDSARCCWNRALADTLACIINRKKDGDDE